MNQVKKKIQSTLLRKDRKVSQRKEKQGTADERKAAGIQKIKEAWKKRRD